MCKSTQPQRVLALLFVYDSRTRTVSVLACYSTACVLVLARTSKIFYERKLWYTPYVVTCNVCTASILGRYQDTLGFAVFRVSRRLNIEYCVRYSSSRCKYKIEYLFSESFGRRRGSSASDSSHDFCLYPAHKELLQLKRRCTLTTRCASMLSHLRECNS